MNNTEIFKGLAKGDNIGLWTPSDSLNTITESADGKANVINMIKSSSGMFGLQLQYSSQETYQYINKLRDTKNLSFTFIDGDGLEVVSSDHCAIQGKPEVGFGEEVYTVNFVVLVGTV